MTTEPRTAVAQRSFVVASGTLLSRVTGLARLGATVAVLGDKSLNDIYNAANNMPNIVFELLLGGVLSASLVPVFMRANDDDDAAAAPSIIAVSMLVLFVFTVVAMIGAPIIAAVFTDRIGAANHASARSASVLLVRLFMPQMLFYGFTALATAALNARRRFVAAAYAPLLNNVVVIAMILAFGHRYRHPTLNTAAQDRAMIWLLGGGTTLGIVAMGLALWVPLRRSGTRITARNVSWHHPAVRRIASLSTWTFGYVVANQVAVIFTQWLSGANEGAYSHYLLAYSFFILPHGLIAVSIMTVVVPEFVAAIKTSDRQRLFDQYSQGLRYLIVAVTPAAAGFVALGRPIIKMCLQYGHFNASGAATTATALQGFAIGLVPFSVYLYVLRLFYAHEDTRTPFRINVVENLINIALAALLFPHYGVRGLAVSFSIAYLAAAGIALRTAHRTVLRGGPNLVTFLPTIVRSSTAAAISAFGAWLMTRWWGNSIAATLLACAVAVTAYAGLLIALRTPEFSGISRLVASKTHRDV